MRHLFDLMRARLDARGDDTFAPLVLDECLCFRLNSRQCDWHHFIGLQGGVRYASYVPQLHEHQPACLVHGVRYGQGYAWTPGIHTAAQIAFAGSNSL
ncbi:hypothetical protein AWB77_01114 [Caballeronia fortuita]|uniref:Uncharacterized protein n=1 Tax=Caballeronia fortuita TaxID=1777138 RepID=A0A157ZUW0_9BURK|nr:hypothetical protein AWB77_01114 [Caballeronia fortuita]